MIFYIVVGLLSGVISGMGIGGGTLLIPALVFLKDLNQQTAQNINLIYFIPTAIVSLIVHKKNSNIETKIVWKLVIFGLIGAVAGSLIGRSMKPEVLKKLFGFFLLLMGILEFFKKEDKNEKAKKS